jgi:hypothetical protein
MTTDLSPDFVTLANAMPPTLRSLLVDGEDPSAVPVHALLTDLRVDPARHLLGSQQARVMSVPSVLDATACKILREAVDKHEQHKVDSVDGAPDHQVGLSLDTLERLVGSSATRALCRLPHVFTREAGKHAATGTFHHREAGDDRSGLSCEDTRWVPSGMFVRRYSGSTRPWIAFHADNAAVTINVALTADAAHRGGRLVAIVNERLATMLREEGEATVHDSRLLHAVTRTTGGVRYSLIMFFGKREVAESDREAEAFDGFMQALPTASRQRLAAELADLEAPAAKALKDAEMALEKLIAQRASAHAALEQAQLEASDASMALSRAEAALREATWSAEESESRVPGEGSLNVGGARHDEQCTLEARSTSTSGSSSNFIRDELTIKEELACCVRSWYGTPKVAVLPHSG